MGIEAGLKKAGLKKKDVLITGDIGCTILGISPPFEILWTELAMGASIPLAQGFAYSNIPSPIIATIGDSTFFHAGMTGLVNAVQHHINMTVVILDNGWTAMTGMQVNPGTVQSCQMGEWQQLDLIQVVKGLGISEENLYVVDPYDHLSVADAVKECLEKDGVKLILSRRECAIQAARRKVKYSPVKVIPEKCIMCRSASMFPAVRQSHWTRIPLRWIRPPATTADFAHRFVRSVPLKSKRNKKGVVRK